MDLRHVEEPRVVVVNAAGVDLPERRVARRTLRSLLGIVVVPRWLYCARAAWLMASRAA